MGAGGLGRRRGVVAGRCRPERESEDSFTEFFKEFIKNFKDSEWSGCGFVAGANLVQATRGRRRPRFVIFAAEKCEASTLGPQAGI